MASLGNEMKYTSRVKVLGMKAVNSTMDGQTFDSTKVYLETPLDDTKGTAKGFASSEYSMGDHKEYGKYAHLPFPFEADAEMEVMTSGKMTKVVLHSIKPVSVSKSAA